MYLHIGKGVTVREKDIIGIFDLDTVSISTLGRAFLSSCEKKKIVSYGDDDLPRSFVLVDGKDGERFHVHLSHISSTGLTSRAKNKNEE